MTRDEWLRVRVGDFLVDRKLAGHPRREVVEVNRCVVRTTKRTRTTVRVPSLKSAGALTIVFDIDDSMGGPGRRFEYVPKEEGRWFRFR